MAENFYQGWQNSNRCPLEQYMKFFFQKRDIRYFSRFWAISFLLAKIFARFAEPAIYGSVDAFGEFFLKFQKSFTLIWNFFEKKPSVGIFFPGCHNCNARFYRHILRKEKFLKQSFFCSSVLEFEQFFSLLTKKVRVSKKQPDKTEKNWGEKIVEKLFFISLADLEQKVWTIRQKTLATLSKPLSRCSTEQFLKLSSEWRNSAQVFWLLSEIVGLLAWVFLSNFLKLQPRGGCSGTFWCFFGEKCNCLIVFDLSAKVTVFWQKNYGRLPKLHFMCPQQNFEKKW